MKNNVRAAITYRLIFATLLMMGFVETGSAATCAFANGTNVLDGFLDTGDVTIGSSEALDCGYGTVNNDGVAPPPSNWQVNIDDAGNLVGLDWNAYYKQDIDEGNPDVVPPIPPSTEGTWSGDGPGEALGSPINLQITAFTGMCPDPDDDPQCQFTEGEFTLNASDPLLVVLKEGKGDVYTWYYFENKTGSLTGTWNTENPFGGKNLGTLAVYEIGTPVPVPAAVWLFGTGLLGLVGVARRSRKA